MTSRRKLSHNPNYENIYGNVNSNPGFYSLSSGHNNSNSETQISVMHGDKAFYMPLNNTEFNYMAYMPPQDNLGVNPAHVPSSGVYANIGEIKKSAHEPSSGVYANIGEKTNPIYDSSHSPVYANFQEEKNPIYDSSTSRDYKNFQEKKNPTYDASKIQVSTDKLPTIVGAPLPPIPKPIKGGNRRKHNKTRHTKRHTRRHTRRHTKRHTRRHTRTHNRKLII
jgi:hypothetical protein